MQRYRTIATIDYWLNLIRSEEGSEEGFAIAEPKQGHGGRVLPSFNCGSF